MFAILCCAVLRPCVIGLDGGRVAAMLCYLCYSVPSCDHVQVGWMVATPCYPVLCHGHFVGPLLCSPPAGRH